MFFSYSMLVWAESWHQARLNQKMESRHLLERFGSPGIPKLLKDTLDCIENVLMTSVKTKTVTNDLKAMQFWFAGFGTSTKKCLSWSSAMMSYLFLTRIECRSTENLRWLCSTDLMKHVAVYSEWHAITPMVLWAWTTWLIMRFPFVLLWI